MLPSLGAAYFFRVCFLPWIVFIQPNSVSSYTRGTLLKANGFSVLPPQAYNLNCTAVGQSGSNIALGTFLGRREKKNGAIRIAILLSWELNLICSACCNPTHPAHKRAYGIEPAVLLPVPAGLAGVHPRPPHQRAEGVVTCHTTTHMNHDFSLSHWLTCFWVQDSGFHLHPGWKQIVSFSWVLHGFCATSTTVQSSLLHKSEELLL